MSKFFELLFGYSSSSTILLYCFIFFAGTLFAFLSQSSRGSKFKLFYFILSFIILWIFYAFNDIGIDTPHYRAYFNNYRSVANIESGFGAVEIWYQYLNILLHNVTNDATVAVAIVRTFQLAGIYLAIFLLREKIVVGYAVMAYLALFYFQSFDLLRSSLAGSLCLLSFVFSYRKKHIWSIIFSVVAFEIHHSAALFLAATFIYYLSLLFRKHSSFIQALGILGVIIVIMIGGDIITTLLAGGFGGGRYESYIDNAGSSFGLFVIIQYLPIAYILYLLKMRLKTQDDISWWNICFVYAVIGFAIAILGYRSGILTRAAIYFSSSFIFLLPGFMKSLSIYISRNNLTFFKCLALFYFVFQFMTNVGNCYEIDGIGPFKFI